MYLIFDTETTGLPKNFNAPYTDLENWPRLVQLAWQLHDNTGKLLNAQNLIVKPEGFTIPFNAEKIHGISTEIALEEGKPLAEVMQVFAEDIAKSQILIGHNVKFDLNITGAEFLRAKVESKLWDIATYNTANDDVATFTQIPGGKGGKFKFPTLTELYTKLFGKAFDAAHDAAYDVEATSRIYFGLLKQDITKPFDDTPLEAITYEAPKLDEANFVRKKESKGIFIPPKFRGTLTEHVPFTHLHTHTQFSILQSTSNVKKLIAKAKKDGMTALAITDYGNMHVAFNAVANQSDDFKIIMGCEVYMVKDRHQKKFTKGNRDQRFRQVLLATNQDAYHRLAKLCSSGYIDGYYSGVPRVDRELIQTYSEGLIALSGSLNAEIPHLILNVGEHEAEEAFKWWLEVFGENFYVELQRHGLEEEERVNEVLLKFADKYNVKPIAAHNSFYIDKADADAHDTLLCVKEGEKKSTEKMFQVDVRRRNKRFALPNDNFYFKTQGEMNELFSDIPVALENVQDIVGKCSPIKLKHDILMPRYEMPPEFETQGDYLRHLSFEGAKKVYGEVTPEVEERLNTELKIINDMGFPGYFLIVQDFINVAKDMGVFVGPGRGSAAGSAVAYCIGITNIDPIKYNLLFERFLNPERVSMPDIDIDFDDEGRQEAINYVIEKYGKNQVAQIITYGTMAAKMAIKDVARVQELPLDESNKLAKLVPERPGIKLKDAFAEVTDLRKTLEQDGPKGKVLKEALILEGSVRNTGIHAAGVIIAPDDITKYIPVCTSKDADLLVTQFDGRVVEDAGMLKMDFLGLKTLTILRDALKMIKRNHGKDIDLDTIPLDDQKTFELYQKGDTIGTFQFESPGMQKYLRELKPTDIEDLIAMNALYRPGPLQFIPNFINRKHGREKIEYPHELLEPILKNSNGIMVYQEQIMQTAQILGGYTLGGADLLRRAMGKKKIEEMNKQEVIFIKGAKEKHGIPESKSKEVFDVMKEFAKYGFNRSHSAAYSVVAYQTAYLKANFTAEYMASVLTHNMSSIEKVTFFIEECQNQDVEVLGPDINESQSTFGVNEKGQIRFGLAAIKGTGDAAISSIIQNREEKGKFEDIFDFTKRIDLRTVNKKSFESLVMAGAFDSFGIDRANYFYKDNDKSDTFIGHILRYGNAYKKDKENSSSSLFGGSAAVEIATPKIPKNGSWTKLEKLNHEKEVVGFYVSGHPMEQFRNAMKSLKIRPVDNLQAFDKQEVNIAGVIASKAIKNGQRGAFTVFVIEDFRSNVEIPLFGKSHEEFSEAIEVGKLFMITGKVRKDYRSEAYSLTAISKVQNLEDLQDKHCKGLLINIDLESLNEALIGKIESLCQKYAGNYPLRIVAFDRHQKLKTDLSSKLYKVDASDKLIHELEKASLECRILY